MYLLSYADRERGPQRGTLLERQWITRLVDLFEGYLILEFHNVRVMRVKSLVAKAH
jgi:hypothetical protein